MNTFLICNFDEDLLNLKSNTRFSKVAEEISVLHDSFYGDSGDSLNPLTCKSYFFALDLRNKLAYFAHNCAPSSIRLPEASYRCQISTEWDVMISCPAKSATRDSKQANIPPTNEG